MKENLKRYLGLLLAVILVVSMVPASAVPALADTYTSNVIGPIGMETAEGEKQLSVDYVSGADTYRVTMTYTPEALIPDNAELRVSEILPGTPEFDAYVAESAGALGWDESSVSDAKVMDISIFYDGLEVQPSAPVTVEMVLVDQPADDWSVVHFGSDETQVLDSTADGDALSFETDGFSVFVFAKGVLEKTLVASDGNTYRVTMSFDSEKAGIPENAELVVKEILQEVAADPSASSEYDEYLSAAESTLGKNQRVTFARFFDITILADGQEIQPAAPVDVKIELANDELTAENTEDVKAVHFSADGSVTSVDTNVENQTITFTADGFSVYGFFCAETITVPFVAGDGTSYEVTVTFGTDAGIPDDAQLVVEELTVDNSQYSAYADQAAAAVGTEVPALSYIKLLDISIVKNGEKITLNAPVDVSIRLMDKEQSENPTQVVHFADNAETPEVISPSVETTTVSFETQGFSIYAIVEGETVLVPQRTYHFVRLNEETGAIEPYYFYNTAGEKVDNQIIKTGDSLEAINTPFIPDEQTWSGWRVANITGLDENYNVEPYATEQNYTSISYGREVVFSEPLTVTTTEDVYVIPYFGQYHIITFIDYLFEGSSVSGYLIHSREEVPLGTTYDTTVQTVPSHKAVGGASEADLVFAGWRLLHDESEMHGFFKWEDGELKLNEENGITSWSQVDATDTPDGHAVAGVQRDENKYVIAIEMDPNESRNYVLLPVYQFAHWVEYYSAPTGSGATYVAPVHVGVLETLEHAGARPTADMRWRGYEFQYWTTENTFDADGKPIEFEVGSEPEEFNSWNQTIDSDLKLYAYWKKAESTYTVMYWRQQLDDDKDLAPDEKHYDYAGQRTGTAMVDSTVTLTTADQNMNVQRYNSEYQKYTGFSYVRDDAATKTVKADGSTVINVYYDRNRITMNFDRDISSYTETEDTTGTLYGLVDGSYVQLTYNGTNWVYTTTEQVTEYVDYPGTRYNQSTNDNDNQPQKYGVDNGRVVPIYYHSYQFFGTQWHWSTNQYHSAWDGYDGSRYVVNSNGSYGFVDGEMVPLTNGQYPTTTTRTVEHVYDGPRYSHSTTRSFTGLYGQLLEKYGYQWPYEYVWNYQITGNGTKGMSYLGEFVLPLDVRDTEGKVINLSSTGSATNYQDFYLQDPESSDLTNPNSYRLEATGSYDFNPYQTVNFELSDKFEGYTVQGYRRYTGTGTNKRYVDNNIVPAAVGNTVTLKQNGYSYNFEVYFRVFVYDIAYKHPIDREVISTESFKYGAAISNDGAPEIESIEVPAGYRLITDNEGNIIWYADPNHVTEFKFDRTMPNHDLEVFPGFEPIYFWIKIEPNGGQLSGSESTWFWEPYGSEEVSEYEDVERKYQVDDAGEYYYHYDEFVDPVNDVNQYGTRVRKAEYRLKSSYEGPGTWEDDSYDGKSYSPSTLYSLDGWYEVTVDEATGKELLIPYHFGSPVMHNTTLRAVWIKTGSYAIVYETEGVDASGNPLYTAEVDGKTVVITETTEGSVKSYTYKDDNGDPVTITDQSIIDSKVRLTGMDAPVGGKMYEDEADAIILHRPDPPAGYLCTGYYFNGNVYLPGEVFKIISDNDGADGDVDMKFTFYPIYEPFSERNVQVTNLIFNPNVDDLNDVTLDSTIQDEFEDQVQDGVTVSIQKQKVDTTAKTVEYTNRQVNADMTLHGEIFTRPGYELIGWSLTPGENNEVDFNLGQEHVTADNLTKDATNTDANTLYAVWEIKTYTLTVEKVVQTSDNFPIDLGHRFTFVPSFSEFAGITNEFRTNFMLTGNISSDSNKKTFKTEIPYGTSFYITESKESVWDLSVQAFVTDDTGMEEITNISNGEGMTMTGDTKLVFTNSMQTVPVRLIKVSEDGASDDTSETSHRIGTATFTLFRKTLSTDDHYDTFMSDITVNKFREISLPVGHYLLQETSAPDGYTARGNSWTFVVGYDGKVYADNQTDLAPLTTGDTSDGRPRKPYNSLVLINHPGVTMPATGGEGTLLYTFCGVGLMALSALMYSMQMRRRKKESEE